LNVLPLNIYMENTQLTLADLASIHSIIEAATTRGAFRANELTPVGAIYDKLTAFLQAANASPVTADSEPQAPQAQGEQNA
jgi:hypothetical protein